MNYPDGRCRNCGHRLYEQLEGHYRCPNCETVYSRSTFDEPSA
ncbi:hypothetical protein [Natronobacterium gregoryi]|uniref:Uncharacterized protein n=1 Tax=Natronobacterium gregoryi (strain ATCC 43098 / DSM 3393 / CCM 3738 / CIP 104747 / IAM 13177 / JCM 8860 / NBRC 102187 / NCIMB 2189 / SP2) TaxID=797304 RepID=L9Y165_NATGS|nr:hypothetical protein [Natronobacterium gregoryi]ELY66598.1 hypothetical protein C490_12537 [Natronobacterium gregoryi SP2]